MKYLAATLGIAFLAWRVAAASEEEFLSAHKVTITEDGRADGRAASRKDIHSILASVSTSPLRALTCKPCRARVEMACRVVKVREGHTLTLTGGER
jgi:hypothetical protein